MYFSFIFLLVCTFIHTNYAEVELQEDKDLLFLRRRQETRCNETACIIKFFDARIEPYHFVSDCKADKIKTVTFVDVIEWEVIPAQLFVDLKFVKSLNIVQEGVDRVVVETFKDAKHLEQLDLSNNSISELQGWIFEGSRRLVTVVLAHNRISEIGVDVFRKLTHLKNLNLANNLIEVLDEKTFADNERLHILDLSGNRISMLGPKIFFSCPDLTWLHLQHNRLENLNLKLKYNSLFWLNADENQIQELVLDAEETIPKVQSYINANKNKIFKVKISQKFNVRNLYLESNDHIDLFDLRSMTSLADLRLGNNRLSHVSSIVFSNWKNLEILYMHNTNLSAIRAELFTHQKKLKILHVGYNHLGFVDLRFLKGLKVLEELYLDGNDLVDLNVGDIKDWLPALKKIELRNNKWSCRSLKSVMSYLNAYEIELISREVEGDEPNDTGIRCYDEVEGMEELKCQIAQLEAQIKLMQEAYNANLKLMKTSECCNLAEARSLVIYESQCKA